LVKEAEDAKKRQGRQSETYKSASGKKPGDLKTVIDYQSITYQERLVILKYESNLPFRKCILMIFKPLKMYLPIFFCLPAHHFLTSLFALQK
jgi:hypothetical protein